MKRGAELSTDHHITETTGQTGSEGALGMHTRMLFHIFKKGSCLQITVKMVFSSPQDITTWRTGCESSQSSLKQMYGCAVVIRCEHEMFKPICS